MNDLLFHEPITMRAPVKRSDGAAAKARFRQDFMRSLNSCIRRNFSVAECFGTIWQETLDAIALTDLEQAEVYPELLEWAKQRSK